MACHSFLNIFLPASKCDKIKLIPLILEDSEIWCNYVERCNMLYFRVNVMI